MAGYPGGTSPNGQAGSAAGLLTPRPSLELPPWLKVRVDRQGPSRTVQLRGRLGVGGLAPVKAVLTELLTGEGTVVCDLDGLEYLSPLVLRMLLEVQATRPPTAPALALCAPSGQVSQVLAAFDPVRLLPRFATAVDAHRDLSRERRRAALALEARPEAAGRSRVFAAETCAGWSLHTIVDDVVLLVSELVTNAVVHARTEFELHLANDRGMVSIEVVDHAAGPAAVGSPDRFAEGGRGLLLVSRLAYALGSYLRPGGGKVVWCALRLPAAA